MTFTVKEKVPLAVGVPSSSPELDRLTPDGRLPETTDQVSGGSTDACNCTEYDEPTAPLGTDAVVIVRKGSIFS